VKQESRRSCCIRPTDNEKAAFDDTSETEASGVGLPISQPAAFAGRMSLTGQYCVGMRRFQKLSLVRKRWWRWWCVVCGWVLESSEGAVVGGSNLRFSPTFHGIHTRGQKGSCSLVPVHSSSNLVRFLKIRRPCFFTSLTGIDPASHVTLCHAGAVWL